MQKKNILWAILISLIGLSALISSVNLGQKNPETIFLTTDSIIEYEEFKKIAPEKHTLILKRKHEVGDANLLNKERALFYEKLSILEKLCVDTCEVITAKKLNKNNNNQAQHQTNDLMTLESDGVRGDNNSAPFSAAIFIDDVGSIHKEILTLAGEDDYWKQSSVGFAGISYTNFLLDKYSLSIQKTLFPAMFIIGFLLTFFFIKDPKESLIIYLPCLYMAGLSLFTLKMVDGHMNMVTSIIPLVVFTICLSLSFHTYFSIKEFKNLRNFLMIKWRPLFLMIFTTYVGFLSLYVAEIKVVKEFGLISSQLILLGVILMYAWFKNFEVIINENPNKGRLFHFERIFHKTVPLWAIVLLTVLGLFSAIYFPKKLEIITDATRYFPASSKLREGILDVTKTVSGMPITEISLDLNRDLDIALLNEIEKIENDLKLLNLSQKYRILSNNNLVKLVNSLYVNEEKIPDNMASYLTLRSQLPYSLQQTYEVERNYRLTFMGSPINVEEYKKDLAQIQNVLNKYNIKYRINGLHHNLMTSQDAMIGILYESFLISSLLVFVVSALYLKKPRLIIGFTIVNAVPILLAFLFMYVMNYSINIATVMTFSIALGLLGDSTFHISHAKLFPFKSFTDYANAVLTPVLLSGVLLFLCFVIFMFNDFHPIKEFGGILAFMILGGYLCDLYLLPTLIYFNSKHKDVYDLEIKNNQKWLEERQSKLK